MNSTPLPAKSRGYHLDYTISIGIISFVAAILLCIDPNTNQIHPIINLTLMWISTFILSFILGALLWFIAILFSKSSRKKSALFKYSAIACISLFIYTIISVLFLA